MDFTETPHAEDFQYDLNQLIEEYIIRGIKYSTIAWVFENLSYDFEDD